MRFFSPEEFDKMYREILDSACICYDTLLYLSHRALFGLVCQWCRNDPALRGQQYEEDIMQEIQIRLIKSCVTGFFLRNHEPNYDPEGFQNWLFTVALNVKKDFAKKIRQIRFMEMQEAESEAEVPFPEEPYGTEAMCERLNNAFRLVMASDSKVYKVLTWMAQLLIIVRTNVTKIESNQMIVDRFDAITLDAMFAYIEEQAVTIPWLQLGDAQMAHIRRRLNERQEDGRRIGEMMYRDFYMKKGAKASISDWVNRLNNYIIKEEKRQCRISPLRK